MELLYSDSTLVAVNKPSGLVVHRSELAADRDNCMRRLRRRLGAWVYPVHRLDRGASGVLVFGMSPAAARGLAEGFARRQVVKTYLAAVRGFAPLETVVDHALAVHPGGQRAEALTRLRRIACAELPFPVGRYATARYSLVEAQPQTGRTHQLRRHLAHLSHPIVGDVTHGDGRHNRFFREHFGVRRLLLHAWTLAFPHPVTGQPLVLRAQLPDELLEVFSELGWPHELESIAAAG